MLYKVVTVAMDNNGEIREGRRKQNIMHYIIKLGCIFF